jgi:hypothetical protein
MVLDDAIAECEHFRILLRALPQNSWPRIMQMHSRAIFLLLIVLIPSSFLSAQTTVYLPSRTVLGSINAAGGSRLLQTNEKSGYFGAAM